MLLNFDFNADPEPAFHSNANADPDPASKNNADPDPQPWLMALLIPGREECYVRLTVPR
jgi:hypothetical protein